MMKWSLLLLIFLVRLPLIAQRTTSTQTIDYRLFDPNKISIWFGNNGDVAFNPNTNAAGLEYPARSGKTLVFESGVIWGGLKAGSLRVGGSTYNHGLQPGIINPNFTASNPNDPRFRIYRISKSMAHDSVKDYREWPCGDGAPCDPITKKPLFIGDDQMWWVSNDLEPRLGNLFFTQPIGLEIQSLVWSDRLADWMDDIIFVKNTIIHKDKVDTLKEMYLGLWNDFDIGDGNDDFVGCDTIRKMTYGYNATQVDAIYKPPAACAYMFLQTPIRKGSAHLQAYFRNEWRKGLENTPLRGHVLWALENTPFGNYYPLQVYDMLQGKLWNGVPYIDPLTGSQTTFYASGDPLTGTGWIDGIVVPPGDRQTLLSCGPFTIAPGDTQEVVYAIIAAQGIDRLQSVKKLQLLADKLRMTLPVSVKDTPLLPENVFIENFPNPFSSREGTTIRFRINPSQQLDEKNVSLDILNVLRRRIITLQARNVFQNEYEAYWNGRDENGLLLPAGVYFIRSGEVNSASVRKLVLMR